MQFLFQPLTWGFLLVGVPVLIHLINMLRHRRLKWAAMDFLLESYRRNRRWVLLKQWLLLAARMLAMLLLVGMLAGWVSNSQMLGLLGGQTTHHYLLLDDSYSMSEIDQSETAYVRGLRAISGLVRKIANQPGQHQLTLLRLSRASLATQSGREQARIDAAADLMAQSVPRNPDNLLDRVSATQPAGLQLSPIPALDLITPLIVNNTSEQAHVYLLSDVRRNEFGEPEELKNKFRELSEASANLHLIDCGGEATANLSVANVEPEQEVWAAGVPLMIRFQVRNQSNQTARNVVATVRAISYADGATQPQPERPYSGDILELPPVLIEQIAAGETVTRQVQVVFGVAGKHVVEISLPDDSLATDNRRWCVIGIREAQRILLVDGEFDRSNAFYFQTVLAPDPRLRTGMTADQVDTAYLRDVAPETLNSYDVVALLDVPRLEPQAIAKLEDFGRAGGGLLVVCGRNTNLQFVNESLYRAGQGLFPVRLAEIREQQNSGATAEPPVAVTEHPLLAPLGQLSSNPFSLLSLRQYLIPDADTVQRPGVEVVATGPSNTPLLIDQPFGSGRSLALLTGLSKDWSTWAQDPTFVVVALRSLGYLGSFRRAPTSQSVGSPMLMVSNQSVVLPEAEILLPASSSTGPRLRWLQPVVLDQSANAARVEIAIDMAETNRELIDGLLRPGVIEAWMVDAQGKRTFQNFAYNVAAAEGNVERVAQHELERALGEIPVQIRSAQAVSGSGLNADETAQSTLLMGLLALLLFGEQILAYSASYHAPRVAGGV